MCTYVCRVGLRRAVTHIRRVAHTASTRQYCFGVFQSVTLHCVISAKRAEVVEATISLPAISEAFWRQDRIFRLKPGHVDHVGHKRWSILLLIFPSLDIVTDERGDYKCSLTTSGCQYAVFTLTTEVTQMSHETVTSEARWSFNSLLRLNPQSCRCVLFV